MWIRRSQGTPTEGHGNHLCSWSSGVLLLFSLAQSRFRLGGISPRPLPGPSAIWQCHPLPLSQRRSTRPHSSDTRSHQSSLPYIREDEYISTRSLLSFRRRWGHFPIVGRRQQFKSCSQCPHHCKSHQSFAPLRRSLSAESHGGRIHVYVRAAYDGCLRYSPRPLRF